MRTLLMPILLAVLLTGIAIPRAVGEEDDWGRHPGWIGSWQATPDIERLLGIKPRKGKPKFPTKLQVSFLANKKAAVAVMGKESIELIEARYAKMKHTIIAAGKWDAGTDFKGFQAFRGLAKKDAFCFVTTSQGATFLWFGTPDVMLKGAEVHFIHGVDSKHDLLVLDFGLSNVRARLYAGDTVGYKRANDRIPAPEESDDPNADIQVDQSNLPVWGGRWTAMSWVQSQTFRPSLSVLTGVDIDIRTANPNQGDDVITVEILKSGTVIATASQEAPVGFEGLLHFDFNSEVPVNVGETYVLRVPGTKDTFGWKYGDDMYSEGMRSLGTRAKPDSDWRFQTYGFPATDLAPPVTSD